MALAPTDYQVNNFIRISDPQIAAALPRKNGLWDSEAYSDDAPPPATKKFFSNGSVFADTTSAYGTSKVNPRDTNLSTNQGMNAKGEKLFAYGIRARFGLGHIAMTAIVPATGATNVLDEIRRFRELSALKIEVNRTELVEKQLTDIPSIMPRLSALAVSPDSDAATANVPMYGVDGYERGMLDISLNGNPYLFDEQENVNVVLLFNDVGSFQFTEDVLVTLAFAGTRLRAIAQ